MGIQVGRSSNPEDTEIASGKTVALYRQLRAVPNFPAIAGLIDRVDPYFVQRVSRRYLMRSQVSLYVASFRATIPPLPSSVAIRTTRLLPSNSNHRTLSRPRKAGLS